MYQILGGDGKEYGPASADEIRQWIADGRVNAQTQARAEGGVDWNPLSEFPEFGEALAGDSRPHGPGTASLSPKRPPPVPAATGGSAQPGAQSSGLAVTSLVLGILSVVGCLVLTGIPAIITGHMAHNRARRTPAAFGGGGMAIAGLVMGYASVVLTLTIAGLAGLMLPALGKAKARAQEVNCVSNLKQIALAARMYANDHNDTFPPDFASMAQELASPKVLCCPADGSRTRAETWAELGPENISYEFVTPGIVESPETTGTVAFRCTVHDHVGLVDGSVERRGGNPPGRSAR